MAHPGAAPLELDMRHALNSGQLQIYYQIGQPTSGS